MSATDDNGPDPSISKYDDDALGLLQKYDAQTVVVFVWGGAKGNGACHKSGMTISPALNAIMMRDAAFAMHQVANDLLIQASELFEQVLADARMKESS